MSDEFDQSSQFDQVVEEKAKVQYHLQEEPSPRMETHPIGKRTAEERRAIVEQQAMSHSKLPDGASRRYVPIALILADSILATYRERADQTQDWPSVQEILMGAISKGMTRLDKNPLLTLVSGFRKSRLYDQQNKELVFWIPEAVLKGFKPRDRKGYLELAAIAAVDPQRWRQYAEERNDDPSREDVMGLF